MPNIKLFCIPFAGGTSFCYSNWKEKLKQKAEVIPVELSGKGLRNKESLNVDFSHAVEDIYSTIIQNILGKEPLGIYGHSMGALLVYELYYVLEERGIIPEFVVLSGITQPNNFSCNYVPYHDEEQMAKYLDTLGSIPPNIKKSYPIYKEIINLVQEDYKILATYRYAKHNKKINSRGYIINGKEDFLINGMETNLWGTYFKKPIRSFLLPGGHFSNQEFFTYHMKVLKGICSEKY